MIEFKTGDILAEDAEALVNTVNCVGVMGRGIALQFKKAFPDNFRAYSEACKRGEVQPGRPFLYETGGLTNPLYIINFPTKRHWRGDSRLEDIDTGLAALAVLIREHGIRSIAVPPLGSGLGGLDWNQVRPRIEETLVGFNELRTVVFEPTEVFEKGRTVRSRKAPKMTSGRAALVGLIDRYLNGLLDPFITLLEVHKLMYFMQVAGQPLKLKFNKALYGPYAENLRHVLHAVEGHFISGYADGGDAPDKVLGLVPGAVQDATAVLNQSHTAKKRFDRVADLVEGFESAFGLELLSTVHWVLECDTPATRDDLVARTHAWNERKKRFSPRQIQLAADVLVEKGWVDAGADSIQPESN
ncbi:MAG: macro domain-containing protein [Gammaproteobacteria bacterium]|nr:macro domain-containing protein [Gammaproteobacteria bacterium]MYG12315.1 macro domain-containing protein [Gammaproteobacteria bacterium]MYH16743.1 macro domain-containing protein [Gammaproteobacteria bacterium]MYK27888.1 macro domain-containing protein [Gammaproteobacteria bacterium]MYK84738.1 macro domain-containing protein [Gammaproteobacteria bacterium]